MTRDILELVRSLLKLMEYQLRIVPRAVLVVRDHRGVETQGILVETMMDQVTTPVEQIRQQQQIQAISGPVVAQMAIVIVPFGVI